MKDYDIIIANYLTKKGFKTSIFNPYWITTQSTLHEKKGVVEAIKFILSKNDKEAYKWLWNNFGFRQLSRVNVKDFKSLSPSNVFNFIKKRFNTYNKIANSNFYCFANKPIEGKTIILESPNKEDQALFEKHLVKDGDFVKFANRDLTDENVANVASCYSTFSMPTFPRIRIVFSIKRKEDNKTVGIADLHVEWSYLPVEFMYYIFKPYRKKGYALEAVNLLTEAAFNGLLHYPRETDYNDIFKAEKFKCNLIRITPNENNAGSNALAKKAGFVFAGQDKYAKIDPVTHKYIHSNIYIKKSKKA